MANPSLPSGVRTLLGRLALFFAPVACVLALLEVVLWRTGDSWPLAKVLEAQGQRTGAIFMRGLVDQSLYAYKWKALHERRPEVLALGSSRVMKFRAEMFGDDAARFYNAGGLVTSIEDLTAFVASLPADRTPRLLILGIDSWWLRPGRPSEQGFRISHDGALSWQEHLLALRTLVMDRRFAHAALVSLRQPDTDGRIGVHAQSRGEGFRFDGSLESGARRPDRGRRRGFVDPERPTTVRRIRIGAGFFKAAPHVSADRLQALGQALAALRGRGALIVGFAPPICSEGARLLETDPRHRRFWLQYRDRVKRAFDEQGFPWVDASSPEQIGLDDRYMVDGIHGGETLHVHVLGRMLDDPRVAAALPSASEVVAAALRSSRTGFWEADIPDDIALSVPAVPDES